MQKVVLADTIVRRVYRRAHLIYDVSFKTTFFSPSSGSIGRALDRRRFDALSPSSASSIYDNTPIHRLAIAVRSCTITDEKNSAWRREGVGGESGSEEVMIR